MPLYKIQKRNGSIVDCGPGKIEQASLKARAAVRTPDADQAKILAVDVATLAEERYEEKIPSVEDIQDIVEETLIRYDYADVAKAYILYREKRREVREDRNVVVEVEKTIQEYLDKLDWRVNENANQGYSLGGMILNTSGKVIANY